MIILLHSISDYMVLTIKNIYNKKYNHETIKKFKYIISAQRVIVAHIATH
jgi:hypothetical protein